MIQANELRIGNLVGTNDTVISIDYDYKKRYSIEIMDFIGGTMHVKDSELKPIPLTEEWLLKFGFEKSKFYNNTYSISIETLNGVHDVFIDINANVSLLDTIEVGDFKYVHQLQNIIFSLTGSELVLSTVPEATKPAL